MHTARDAAVHAERPESRAQDAVHLDAAGFEDALQVARPEAAHDHARPAVGRLAAGRLQLHDLAFRLCVMGGGHDDSRYASLVEPATQAQAV